MEEVTQGIEWARKAVEKDQAKAYPEAIELYSKGIQCFTNAISNPSTSSGVLSNEYKSVVLQKISEYHQRSMHLLSLISSTQLQQQQQQTPLVAPPKVSDEDNGLLARLPNVTAEKPEAAKEDPAVEDVSDDDLVLRLNKLKACVPIVKRTSEDVDMEFWRRIEKVKGGELAVAPTKTLTMDVIDRMIAEENALTEDEQIERLLQQTLEDVSLEQSSGTGGPRDVDDD